MTTPNYLACFPDFAAERLPPIPEWWRDVSYVNDTCPSWASGWLYLFIDYEDPERREIQTPHPRFSVRYQNLDTDTERDGISSDDWGAVLRYMILHAEVTDRASGENWLRGLMLIDCVFHLEDSPESIIIHGTGRDLFTPEECAVVRERVAALYRLDWGSYVCPIGFQLWLEGWSNGAPENADAFNVARLCGVSESIGVPYEPRGENDPPTAKELEEALQGAAFDAIAQGQDPGLCVISRTALLQLFTAADDHHDDLISGLENGTYEDEDGENSELIERLAVALNEARRALGKPVAADILAGLAAKK